MAKAAANITVTPYSATYNGNAHTATGSAIGVQGESLSGLVLSGTTHISAGNYAGDLWSFADLTGNYNNATGTVHDSIGEALLTVTANDAGKVYGSANPTFDAAITGFVNGETVGVVGGTPSLTTAATAASEVGSYPIVAASGAFRRRITLSPSATAR